MELSRQDTEAVLARLVEALGDHGFDPTTRDGLLDLSMFSGVPSATLSDIFEGETFHSRAVADLCKMIGLPLEELLRSPEEPFTVVSVFPYAGGSPIRLILPEQIEVQGLLPSLFFLPMDSQQVEAGMTLAVGTRIPGRPTVGCSYVVEDEGGIDVMRCVAETESGGIVLAAVEGPEERRVVLHGPKGLRLVDAADAPQPVITGLVLWTFSLASMPRPAAIAVA